jgi:chromosome segregation ATPase
MPTAQTTDASRLQAIQQLEQTIAQRQPNLDTALATLKAAQKTDAEARRGVAALDSRLDHLEKDALLRAKVAFLNGQALDRGKLTLQRESLSYSGWHGKAELPLSAIQALELANSELPPRAGVPCLGRIWPGKPRPGWSLLLQMEAQAGQPSDLAVIADLRNGALWRDNILAQKEKLAEVAAQRSELAAQRETVAHSATDTGQALATAKAAAAAIQQEIDSLRTELAKLKAEQRHIEKARKEAAEAARQQPTTKRRR